MAAPIKDYYQILQVHHDASPDVIKAAYRKLCTLYHPDTAGDANVARYMSDINEAYRTLSDPKKRTAYHKLWQATFTDRSRHVFAAAEYNGGIPADPAKDVLEQFFHALYTKNWAGAYNCLTQEDQQRVCAKEFSAWREAVAGCFDMQDYRLQRYREFKRCRIGDTVYEKAVEFAAIVNDLDLQTTQIAQSTSHKYVAYDGISWKVCLGVKTVKQATLKYKLLAQRRQNYDPETLYRNAVSKTDPLTGLLSENGFYDEALKEAERYKRHKNPLSLIAFRIHCEDADREIPCMCQCASIIKANSRITDIIGRFGDNQIICLLVETTQDQAFCAAQKYAARIREAQTEPFVLNAGIIEYNGSHAIEDSVFAACSDANKNGNTILLGRKERRRWRIS